MPVEVDLGRAAGVIPVLALAAGREAGLMVFLAAFPTGLFAVALAAFGTFATFLTGAPALGLVVAFLTGAGAFVVVVRALDPVWAFFAGAEYTLGDVTARLPEVVPPFKPRGLLAVCARGPVALLQSITPFP